MHTRSCSVSFIAPAMNKAVVQDIVVAERGTLGKAGRAAGELDIYRVVELQLFGERREAMPLGITGEMGNISEPHRAVGGISADGNDQPQFGQP